MAVQEAPEDPVATSPTPVIFAQAGIQDSKAHRRLLGLLALPLALACNSPTVVPIIETECEPGAREVCACPDATTASRVCDDEGAWSDCACPPTGSGGAGGEGGSVAGAGGSGGAGGAGGSVGGAGGAAGAGGN